MSKNGLVNKKAFTPGGGLKDIMGISCLYEEPMNILNSGHLGKCVYVGTLNE